MSLKAKIEAVIYACEEPVTLAQLVGLLGDEAQAELDRSVSAQQTLSLNELEAAEADPALGPEFDADNAGPVAEAGRQPRQTLPIRRATRTRTRPVALLQRGRTRRLRSKQVRLRTWLRTPLRSMRLRPRRQRRRRGRSGRAWPGCARTSAYCSTS